MEGGVIISPTRPPNYEAIVAAFPVVKSKYGIIFTYGHVIHNPDGISVTPDLHAHEQTHTIQQTSFGMTPERWWEQYINDVDFRLKQEVEAYRAQYNFVMENYGRDQRRALLKHITKALSGSMYGRIVTVAGAKKLVTG